MAENPITCQLVSVRQSADGKTIAFVQFYQKCDRTREESFVDTKKEDLSYEFEGEAITYTVDVPVLEMRTVEYSVDIPIGRLQEIVVPADRDPHDRMKRYISDQQNFAECPSCELLLIGKPDTCPRCKREM